jgi:endo-1,4-beta-xylanase
VTYNCPSCDAPFDLNEEMLGRKGQCYNCDHKFFFPESLTSPRDDAHEAVVKATHDSSLNINTSHEASADTLLSILDCDVNEAEPMVKKKKKKKSLSAKKKTSSSPSPRRAVQKKSSSKAIPALLFLCLLAGGAFYLFKMNPGNGSTFTEIPVSKYDKNGYTIPLETGTGTELERDYQKISSIIKPKEQVQWQLDADKRIEDHRKADLTLQINNSSGSLAGTEIHIELTNHHFHFGGVAHLPTLIKRKRGRPHRKTGVQEYEKATVDRDLYKKTFVDLFNSGGLNNGFKPKLKGGFEAYLPEAIQWFRDNKLHLRGHTLIWPGKDHLTKEVLSLIDKPSQLKEACEDEVRDYAEKWDVDEWDVINEPRANHLIMDELGNEVMADWFKIAQKHVKNPECKLFLNEYQIVSGTKDQFKDKYEEHVQFLLDQGAPLSGLGIQSRIKVRIPPATLYASLERLAKFNLPIKATEFEVADTPRKMFDEQERAEITHEMLTTYFSHPNVTGFYVWTIFQNGTGPTRKTAKGEAPNHGWTSFIVHNDGRLKRNGLVWKYLTKELWNTDIKCLTDAEGKLKIRGFKGDYKITIKHQGKTTVKTYRLLEDSNEIFAL